MRFNDLVRFTGGSLQSSSSLGRALSFIAQWIDKLVGTNAILDSTENTTQVSTTDATPATLFTWTPPLPNCRGKLVAIVEGHAADGSTGVYTRSIGFKVVSGTVSQVGVTGDVEALFDTAPTNLTAANVVCDVTGGVVRVRVVGIAEAMTWDGAAQVQYSV